MTIDSAKTETLPTMSTPDPLPACAPLRLGELVPNFTARSTTGPVSLAAFRGRWLVLFSDRKSFVYGKSVSVRVDLGGLRIIKTKLKPQTNTLHNTTHE